MRSITMILLTLSPTVVYAYVGPGLGIGVIGAILGAIIALVFAILGVVWYPIKRMLKKKAAGSKREGHEPSDKKQERQTTDELD